MFDTVNILCVRTINTCSEMLRVVHCVLSGVELNFHEKEMPGKIASLFSNTITISLLQYEYSC